MSGASCEYGIYSNMDLFYIFSGKMMQYRNVSRIHKNRQTIDWNWPNYLDEPKLPLSVFPATLWRPNRRVFLYKGRPTGNCNVFHTYTQKKPLCATSFRDVEYTHIHTYKHTKQERPTSVLGLNKERDHDLKCSNRTCAIGVLGLPPNECVQRG
jgi:hypothetical protein